jgi:hypothetical protein
LVPLPFVVVTIAFPCTIYVVGVVLSGVTVEFDGTATVLPALSATSVVVVVGTPLRRPEVPVERESPGFNVIIVSEGTVEVVVTPATVVVTAAGTVAT